MTVDEYESILERIPPVTWTPVAGPDHAGLAQRQEYVDDCLRKAAEIVWLIVESSSITAMIPPVPMPDDFLKHEVPQLRKTLAAGGPRSMTQGECWRWRALEIMNLPRTEAASSRRVERAVEPVAEEGMG